MSDDYGCAFCNDADAAYEWEMDGVTSPGQPDWQNGDSWHVCVDCQEHAVDRTEHLILNQANALGTLEPIEAYTAEDLEPMRAILAEPVAYWIEHRTTCRPVD